MKIRDDEGYEEKIVKVMWKFNFKQLHEIYFNKLHIKYD